LPFSSQSLQALLDGQVIDRQLFGLLNKTYKNHVPLQRIMDTSDNLAGLLSGKGFDVKGTGLKTAKGSERQVADILTNVVANAEQATIRAEKNLVDLTVLRFARKHKDLGLFEEVKAKAIGKGFGKKGEEGRLIFAQNSDPLVLALRQRGKPVFLKINDTALATAFRGVGREQIPSVLKPIAFFTRLYSGLHTRFNYEFAFSNNVRDIQEMLVDVSARKGMGIGSAFKALKKDPESKKSVLDFLMGKDTPGAKLYKQMKVDGGTTGGLGLSTRERVALDIEKIRKTNRSAPRRAAVSFVETVDKWNTLFEDATRLSVYKTALENGLSRNRAAFLAKESTINFNKKGTAGPLINAMYMFSNASIQGSTKMLRAMKDPKVAGSVIGTMGISVFAANKWNDFIDPEWRDKITKWDRSSNLSVLLPPGEDGGVNYITIPVSWGLKPIKVGMEYLYDAANGVGNAEEAIKGMMTSVFEAYNPLAGDETIIHSLTPTLLKTPIEISRNRAWYGSKIRPDYDTQAPASSQYFPSLGNSLTGRAFIGATDKVSEMSKGRIEVNPADMNYAFNQYIGGAGKSVRRIVNTVNSVVGGKPVPKKEIPVLNRFMKEKSEEEVLKSVFYSEKEKADKIKAKQKNEDIRRILPVYETAQMLAGEGNRDSAQELVDGLSDSDYAIYQKFIKTDKRKKRVAEELLVFPKAKQVQKLIKTGNKKEAQKIVDDMTESEYRAYLSVIKQVGIAKNN
jgi:hypothetical protein